MENATKALIMAGGILLSMLIIALIIFARSQITDLYNQNDELVEIDDLAKFNEQFAQYNREKVYGYELVSLSNKIADYNFRYSNATGSKNDQKYNPITLKIDLNSKYGAADDPIAYASGGRKLFTQKSYTQNGVTTAFTNIFIGADGIEANEAKYGKQNLQNLCKSVGSIFNKTDFGDKKDAIKKFNSLIHQKTNINATIKGIYDNISKCVYNNSASVETNYNLIQNNFYVISYKYYEYTQFKKAKFKCTGITYDDGVGKTGRVNGISFKFTGKVE